MGGDAFLLFFFFSGKSSSRWEIISFGKTWKLCFEVHFCYSMLKFQHCLMLHLEHAGSLHKCNERGLIFFYYDVLQTCKGGKKQHLVGNRWASLLLISFLPSTPSPLASSFWQPARESCDGKTSSESCFYLGNSRGLKPFLEGLKNHIYMWMTHISTLNSSSFLAISFASKLQKVTSERIWIPFVHSATELPQISGWREWSSYALRLSVIPPRQKLPTFGKEKVLASF